MADLSDIPDEAVTAGVENLRDSLLTADIGLDEFERMGPLSATDVVRGVLAAALPVLNATRPRLVSGDISITERTPHGVWIADGPDPDHRLPSCDGLADCNDCRAYDDLRQHLVEQITLLDEQHQRDIARLRASRDSETADLLQRLADGIVVSARMDDLIGTAEAAARRPIRDELLDIIAGLRHTHTDDCAHKVVPMEVEGASECFYCGPHHSATEFCGNRCDVVRIEFDRAASLRGGQ